VTNPGARLAWPLLIAVVLSAGCLGGAQDDGPLGRDIVVGVPLSITGAQSAEGALTRQGYDLWQRWVDGRGGLEVAGSRHRVVLRYADDQSQPDVSARVTQQLITDGAQFLLGPYGSAEVAADAPVADRDGVVMVEAGGPAQAAFNVGYRYVFGVMSPASTYLRCVLDMAATLTPKPSTIALLTADDSFSHEVAGAVAAYAPVKGFQVVSNDVYPPGTTDLTAYVANARAERADMVLNAGHLEEAIAVSRAARQLELAAKLYAYSVGPATPNFLQALGADADYVFDGSQWTPKARYQVTFGPSLSEYLADYRRTYRTGADPDYHPAQATAAGLALGRAIEEAGSLGSDDVRTGLEALNVMTFFGQIKFDSRGLNIYKPMLVEQVQDGRHRTVWPADQADAKPSYPTPSWASRH
jgi:branched-chain amino acid transport system substrate-binding protein